MDVPQAFKSVVYKSKALEAARRRPIRRKEALETFLSYTVISELHSHDIEKKQQKKIQRISYLSL